jgi:hypothetical protein
MPNGYFRSAFNKASFGLTADVSCPAGIFTRIGKYEVQAGEIVTIGYGQNSGQESAEGRIYVDLEDATPALIPGTLRISIYSPQDRPLAIIGEYRSETLSTGEDDRTKQVPLPESGLYASEDKKIVLEFKADAAATLKAANTTILMDTTEGVV